MNNNKEYISFFLTQTTNDDLRYSSPPFILEGRFLLINLWETELSTA